jgi:DnaD/phage-associated family protein
MTFNGFANGVDQFPVPAPLFGSLLEEIDSLEEFKVIIRMLRMIQQKKGHMPSVSFNEVMADRILVRSIVDSSGIRRGVESAVRRNVFIEVTSTDGIKMFFLNSDSNRNYLVSHDLGSTKAKAQENEPWEANEKRPKIYSLYEENIGLLTPIISEKIKEADDNYPEEWIREAIDIAVSLNKRSWSYISAILERWRIEGKEDGKPTRYLRKSRYI